MQAIHPVIPPKHAGAFRVLHFSDVHAGLAEWRWRYLMDKRFFGRLNQFCTRQRHLALENLERLARGCREWCVDYAVCTGDLTSIGSEEEFLHAEELLEPLLASCGKRNFLYVPGNHDAYVRANAAALSAAFRRLNAGHPELMGEGVGALPASIVAGPVEFVLLNPARPCAIWLSDGALGSGDWAKLDYILKTTRARTRAIVTHFPLLGIGGKPLSWRTKFRGFERLLSSASEGGFQAVLSGHVHRPFLLAPGQCAPAWMVGAGSITIRGSFSLIDIDECTGEITPHLLQL